MLKKKVTSVAMSAVLAATLCPGLALAAPLEAGSAAPEKAPTTLSTQAKKVDVWVLADYEDSYNDNGLLSKYGSWTLKYNKKYKLTSAKYENNYSGDSYSYSYKVNKIKNGRITKATYTSSDTWTEDGKKVTDKDKTVYQYTYNKYGMTKAKTTYYSNNALDYRTGKLRKSSTSTTNYKVNKKGYTTWSRSKSSYADGSSSKGAVTTYKYNKNGYLTKKLTKKHKPYNYSYSKGTLSEDGKYKTVARTTKHYGDETYTSDYWRTFVKISVPKAAVSAVKAQQWSLINNKNNGTVPMFGYYDWD